MLEEALIDQTKLINLHPDEALLYNNRADTRMKLKLYDLAIQDIEQALKLDPSYSVAHVTKGEILKAMGKSNEACSSFDKAIKLGFDANKILGLLADCK